MAFFKQKTVLRAVASGEIISLEAVSDPVFSQKMMGEGFAIQNHDGYVYAPCDGEVCDIFPTQHAITIRSAGGETILIHMGLDTVELKGVPFTVQVKAGQKVAPETLLAIMDLQKLKDAAKDAVIITVLPEGVGGTLLKEAEKVSMGEKVFKVS